MEDPTLNSIADIRRFLMDEEHPFKENEFKEFWESLTEAEKIEFKNMELPPRE